MRSKKQSGSQGPRTDKTGLKGAGNGAATHVRPGFVGWVLDNLPLVLITVVASVLLFSNLGNQSLWQDEAETAVVARTIQHYGTPHGFDGRNYFSQAMGKEYDAHYLWKQHPWVQFYVLVPSLALFGNSTAAARFPFALFGLGSVVLVYFLGKGLWKSKKAGAFASAALALSVPFLILSRQCRYHSPAAFFSLLALYGYLMILERRKLGWLVFSVTSILLFQTQLLCGAAMLAAVGLHALLARRDGLKTTAICVVAVGAINVPWVMWTRDVAQGRTEPLTLALFFEKSGGVMAQLANNVFWPYLLFVPIVLGAWIWLRKGHPPVPDGDASKNVVLLALFCIMLLVVNCAIAPIAYFRYFAPLIPVAALFIGLIFGRLHVVWGVIALSALVLWSPLQTLTGGKAQKNDISTYLYEITHDFNGPVDGIVKYLKTNAKKTDVVATTYEDLPIKFYTDLRVVGGLTGEDPEPIRKADWVIVRANMCSPYEIPVRKFIAENLKASDYQAITLDCPDTKFENREEPDEHLSRTATDAPSVVIYKRIRPAVGN